MRQVLSAPRCKAWLAMVDRQMGFSCPSTALLAMAGWASAQLICVGLAPRAVKVSRNRGEPTTRIFRPLRSAGALDRDLGVGDFAVAVFAPGQGYHDTCLVQGGENLLAHVALRHRVYSGVVREQERQREQVELLDLGRPVDGGAHGHVDHALAQCAEFARLVALDQRDARVQLDVDAAIGAPRALCWPTARRPCPRGRRCPAPATCGIRSCNAVCARAAGAVKARAAAAATAEVRNVRSFIFSVSFSSM